MLKLNLGCGEKHLSGFVNLDKQTGWRFEEGLPYENETVDAITISHALMYVPENEWPAVFAEFSRVLKPGGVIRITEDSTDDIKSERYGGHHDAVTLTTSKKVHRELAMIGLESHDMPSDQSLFDDDSLIQNSHGYPPKVFHIEGVA